MSPHVGAPFAAAGADAAGFFALPESDGPLAVAEGGGATDAEGAALAEAEAEADGVAVAATVADGGGGAGAGASPFEHAAATKSIKERHAVGTTVRSIRRTIATRPAPVLWLVTSLPMRTLVEIIAAKRDG
ncbi:MAG TPA: hypothetical protein VIF09_19375, partial [Polyangiaceae bacterium]